MLAFVRLVDLIVVALAVHHLVVEIVVVRLVAVVVVEMMPIVMMAAYLVVFDFVDFAIDLAVLEPFVVLADDVDDD